MKFTRVLALIVAGVILACTFASCGAAAPITKVTLKIIGDDPTDPILETEVEVQDEAPTVLMAFVEGCIVNEVAYTLTDTEDSVLDIEEYKEYTDEEGNIHFWTYYINGETPQGGRANTIAIKEGDVIEYKFEIAEPDM